MTICLVNGEPAQSVSVTDRGLQYGDGLFETIAVRDGCPRLIERHLARLRLGCERLGIAAPDPGALTHEVVRVAGPGRAIVKIILTRGGEGRGYRPPDDGRVTRICRRFDWPVHEYPWHDTGVEVRWCRTRLALQPLLAGCKHLNRLEQVLARAEWADPRVPEGLMTDAEGCVVSGTQSNLFMARGGELLTPAIDRCGVMGVVRAAVIDAARREGVRVQECRLDPADVMAADELFLTNAIIGVWPIVTLGDRNWPIGTLTRRAGEWMAQC